MSSWTKLRPPGSFKERDLQWMFNRWASREGDGFAVAGAPEWLLRGAIGARRRQRTATGGETFTPDVEWQIGSEHYAVELKSAAKGEPLALAQVLYYADLVAEEHPEHSVVPVIVSQYNMYLRRALRQLQRKSTDGIRYLEHNILESLNGQRWFLWLDDPFAQFEARRPDGSLLDDLRAVHDDLHWYFLPSISSWFAVEQPFSAGETARPLHGLQHRHLSVAKLQPTQEAESHEAHGEWLVWYGETAHAGSHVVWTRDEYYLWSTNGNDGQAPQNLFSNGAAQPGPATVGAARRG